MKLLAATVISLSLRGGFGGFESRIDPHRASRLAAPAEGTGRILHRLRPHRSHLAITENLNGKVVDWMEKVSDEQYRAPPSTTR